MLIEVKFLPNECLGDRGFIFLDDISKGWLPDLSERHSWAVKLAGFFFFSVAQSHLTLYDLMDCSMLGLPVLHHLLEFAQTHVR